jgi:hypothetical protein
VGNFNKGSNKRRTRALTVVAPSVFTYESEFLTV